MKPGTRSISPAGSRKPGTPVSSPATMPLQESANTRPLSRKLNCHPSSAGSPETALPSLVLPDPRPMRRSGLISPRMQRTRQHAKHCSPHQKSCHGPTPPESFDIPYSHQIENSMNRPRYIAAPAIFPAPGMLNGACTRNSGRRLNAQAHAGSGVIPATTGTKCAAENRRIPA